MENCLVCLKKADSNAPVKIPLLILIMIVALAFLAGWGSANLRKASLTSEHSPAPSPGVSSTLTKQADVSASRLEAATAKTTSFSESSSLREEITRAFQESQQSRRWADLAAISRLITAENGREAADAVRNLVGNRSEGFMLQFILAAWARQAPLAALTYAQALPANDKWQEPSVLGAISGWAETDPVAARQWIDSLSSGRLQQRAYSTLMQALAQENPDSALTLLQSGSIPGSQSMHAYSIFGTWAERDPVTAAQRAISLPPGDLRNNALRIVASRWADADIESALTWASEQPASGQQNEILGEILQTWFQQDSNSATEWLLHQPAGPQRDRIIERSSYAAMNEDPATALRLVALMSTPRSQDSLLNRITSNWARSDPASAQKWIEAQTDPTIRKSAWPSFISSFGRIDPVGAAKLVGQIPESDIRGTAITNLANSWADIDPATAANWVQSLDADSRGAALSNVMSQWTRKDPETAMEWFAEVPKGADRDNAIRQFSRSLIESYPEATMEWVNSISDEKVRDAALTSAASSWMRNDSKNARAWINQSSLPAATKQRLSGATDH